MRRSTAGGARLAGAALLTAMFVAGALAGIAFDRVVLAREAVAAPDTTVRPPRHQHPTIVHQLDLTPEQRARVDSILGAGRERMQEFWDEEGPRIRAMVDSTREEIRRELTAEQREEYDRLRREHRERRRGGPSNPRQGKRKGGPEPTLY